LPDRSWAEEPTDEIYFSEASKLYERGDYFGALTLYEKIRTSGKESGELYYNIGNCYLKRKELGEAVLNYERARLFIPRDGDLLANYAYALSELKEPDMKDSSFFLLASVRYIASFVSIDELTILVSIFFSLLFIIGILCSIHIFNKRAFFWSIASIGVLFLFFSMGLWDKIKTIEACAVVTEKEISVRFGPFERATTHFTVYEGMRVMIEEVKGGWVKIARLDGMSGWVETDTIKTLLGEV
jgi:tetratricopeptide (TPR) repeat protein